jgi:EmrB/QacA subfamily drug resistance transporter
MTKALHDMSANPAGGRSNRRWVALVVLCLAQFMLTVDDTIVNVALPSIRLDLGFSVSGLAWVANAYWLMFGGFLLLGGRVGDLVGRRRLLVAGLIVFTAASLANGLAQDPAMLIGARAVQGLGSAMVSPAAMALITLMFREPGERARAFGVWGGIAGAGGALGVMLGGALTELLSWRWIFFINVPVGVAVLVLIPLLVPVDRAASARRRFDFAGAATVTGGLLALVYALLEAAANGWGSPATLVALAGCVALLTAFVIVEARHPEPLVPLGFFRQRVTWVANVLGLITPSAFAGMFFLLTLYLQTLLGYGPLRTGASYLSLVAAMFVAVPLAAGRLIPRLGVRPVLGAGLAIIAAGLATFIRLPMSGNYWRDVAPGLALVGFGAGWAFISVTLAAVAKARPEDTGLASGVINAAQQVGGALALAVYVFVATNRTTGLFRAGVAPASAQVGGYRAAFLVGTLIAAAGAFIAIVGLRGIRPEDARRAAAALHS